jgi:hypothetical protein
MENGVKNLKGARLIPKTFSNNENGDAYDFISFFDLHIWDSWNIMVMLT